MPATLGALAETAGVGALHQRPRKRLTWSAVSRYPGPMIEWIAGGVALIVVLAGLGISIGLATKVGKERAERKKAERDADMLRRINDGLGEPLPTDDDDVRDLMDRS